MEMDPLTAVFVHTIFDQLNDSNDYPNRICPKCGWYWATIAPHNPKKCPACQCFVLFAREPWPEGYEKWVKFSIYEMMCHTFDVPKATA